MAFSISVLGPSASAADVWERWAFEGDLSGAAALASPAVREEGRAGIAVGGLVRFNRNPDWDTGFGYTIFYLRDGVRLRPATLVADRRVGPRGVWSPFIRFGGGLASDDNSGSLNRWVARAGGGAARPLNRRWDAGVKTELWYSPRSGGVGEDMALLTAGLTLSRSFVRAAPPKEAPAPAPVPAEESAAPAAPAPDPVPEEIHVRFRTERWQLDAGDYSTRGSAFDAAGAFLVAQPNARIEVHGHADSRGPADYNKRLSLRRAESLRDALVARWGLDPRRAAVLAHGSDQPVADNATPEGRAKNRRAVLIVFP